MQTFHVLIDGSTEPIVIEAETMVQAAQQATKQGGQVIGLCVAESLTPDATGRLADALLVPRDRLIDHLAQKGADIAYQRMARDQARYQRIAAVILGVVGLVGFGSAGAIITLPIEGKLTTTLEGLLAADLTRMEATLTSTLKDLLNESRSNDLTRMEGEVTRAVEGIVNDQIGAVTTRLNAAEGLNTMRVLSQELGEGESFSNERRDSVMTAISAVVADSATAELPNFIFALEAVVESFAAASLSTNLDTIDDLARKQITKSHGAAGTMAQHYGQRLAGHKEGAAGWAKGTVDRFDVYMGEVRDTQIPAVHLPLELLVLFMKEGMKPGSEGVAALIHEPRVWESSQAQALFHVQLMTYLDEHFWTRKGSTESLLIQRRCRALVEGYHADLDEILLQSTDVQAQVLVLMDELAISFRQRIDQADDETQRQFYVEGRSRFLEYMEHLRSGGYGALVSAENWE